MAAPRKKQAIRKNRVGFADGLGDVFGCRGRLARGRGIECRPHGETAAGRRGAAGGGRAGRCRLCAKPGAMKFAGFVGRTAAELPTVVGREGEAKVRQGSVLAVGR